MVKRTSHGALPHARVVHRVGGEWRFNGDAARAHDAQFYEMRATRPRTPLLKVFVNSLSDLFYEPIVGAGWTAEVYYEMRVCNWIHLPSADQAAGSCRRLLRRAP